MLKFRVSQTVIEISFFWVAITTLSLFMTGKDSLLPLCLVSAVIHESGHLLVLRLFGVHPSKISLKLTDTRIVCDLTELSLQKEFWAIAAGPLANILVSIIAFFINKCLNEAILQNLCSASLCIGIFNLLPIRSLDGEQILSLLLMRKTELSRKNLIINIISAIIILPVATAGFVLVLSCKHNYTLLIVAVFLIFTVISKEMR